jgi:competence protein ComFC
MPATRKFESLLNLKEDILDLIFPQHCVICKKYLSRQEKNVCQACWDNLAQLPSPFCAECKSFIEKDKQCKHCGNEKKFVLVYSLGNFDERYQSLIYAFKYNQLINLGRRLGYALGEKIKEDRGFLESDFIIPVPLHPSRKRKRGFNQSEILALEVAQELNIPVLRDVLKRKKRTKDQTTLNAKQREENVRGAFKVKNEDRISNKKVILVDDVITTGATLRECAKTLIQAGAKEVLGITLAVAGDSDCNSKNLLKSL